MSLVSGKSSWYADLNCAFFCVRMMSSRKTMLAGIASIQFRLPCEMLSVIWSISSGYWTRVTTKWLTQPDRYYSVLNFFGEFPLADQHSLGGRFVGGFIQVHFVHFHDYKPPFLRGLYLAGHGGGSHGHSCGRPWERVLRGG